MKKKPWPTNDAMKQVYEMNLWGNSGAQFYSGEGSHNPEIVNPYIKEISQFLKSFKPPLTVCDLGCGDFNVGKQLVKYSKNYIAIDIVEDLIKHNIETFKDEKLSFKCLDIAKDELPKADCMIIRQVLQHLSNAEILQIVEKLKNYKYIILTEHLPEGDFTPNKDIISGQGIRLKKQSGLNLLVPPFNMKILEQNKVLAISNSNFKGVIETVIYKMF